MESHTYHKHPIERMMIVIKTTILFNHEVAYAACCSMKYICIEL